MCIVPPKIVSSKKVFRCYQLNSEWRLLMKGIESFNLKRFSTLQIAESCSKNFGKLWKKAANWFRWQVHFVWPLTTYWKAFLENYQENKHHNLEFLIYLFELKHLMRWREVVWNERISKSKSSDRTKNCGLESKLWIIEFF